MQILKPKRYDKAEDQKNIELAVLLDQYRCQWCLFKYGKVEITGPPHHIFRKRKRWDIDSVISLCVACHEKVHKAIRRDGETIITKEKLARLMEEKVIPARKWVAGQLGT